MIGSFKEKQRERRELIKVVRMLSDQLDGIMDYRSDMLQVLSESIGEVAETLRRIEVALQSQVASGEAIARYFNYEIKTLEKINAEASKPPGRHDDTF